MNSYNDDVLVVIPDEDLLELYKLYKNLEWAIQATCAIDNGIKWRKKTGDDSMTFVSPYNSWRKDGTFLLLIRIESSYKIFVSTLDEQCKHLYEGLAKTKKIHYSHSPPVVFFSVDHRYLSTVMRVCKEKKAANLLVHDSEIYSISKEAALVYKPSCPPNVYVAQLKATEAHKINEVWPRGSDGSVKTVGKLIEINGGLGIYLNQTDELVAWVLLGPLGQIALLQVVDEHKRRGYGSVLTMLIAQQIAEMGQEPYGTVMKDNQPCLELLDKLGFKRTGMSHYVSFTTK